jgi:hypothetical protein
MENEGRAYYDEAPPQRSRNSVLVSGFSWAQVAARNPQNPQTPSQGTCSNISEIVARTIAQSKEMNELKKLVTLLMHKVNGMLVILERRENHDHRQQHGSGYTPGRQQNYE